MKRLQTVTLILALILVPCNVSNAWNSFRNEDGLHNANITAAKTPVNPDNTYIKWQRRLTETTGTVYNSSPIITETNLYVVCENILYELDKNGTITRSLTLCQSMNSVCHTTLHGNQLFIPLKSGTMECVDISTMTSRWISDSFDNQSLTTTLYLDGYVYAGTSHPNGSDGVFYCLNADTGSTLWTYNNQCGFYWSGACAFDTEEKNGILFGGDNGILVSHAQTDDMTYDTLDLSTVVSTPGKIRAGITYDEQTDSYYTTSTNGYLYKIKINTDGTFGDITAVFLGEGATDSINCTSTPTIYNGRIYVGSFYGTNGRLNVVNADTMSLIYSTTHSGCGDIKSSPLLSTGYATAENNEKLYVYVTNNALPGGISYMEDTETTTNGELHTLIAPIEGKQFCISSVAADSDGTLYYSNDSGYLFAVGIGTAPLPSVTPTPSETPDTSKSTSTASKQKKTKKPGKPSKIRHTAKRKKNGKYNVTLRWKKGTQAKKTCIQFKGKKKQFFKGKKAIFTLKKGRYTVRLTSYGTGQKKSKTVTYILKVK